MAAEGMGAQMQINFTRDQEYEADRVGMTYLAHAGFDPQGMPNFFEVLFRKYGYGESHMPRMLVDHPVTSERIAEARNRAAQIERPKHVEDSVSFGLIQERLRVLTATDDYDLRGYYAGRVNMRDPPLAARVRTGPGATCSVAIPRRPSRSCSRWWPHNQGVIMLHSLLAQAQIAAGHVPGGSGDLRPRRGAVPAQYSADRALRRGPDQRQSGRQGPSAAAGPVQQCAAHARREIRLTALAASSAGDAGDAYYYMGEYNIANGEFQLATQQLELALSAPDLTVVQRKRFQARLKEVRDAILEDRRAHGGRAPGHRQQRRRGRLITALSRPVAVATLAGRSLELVSHAKTITLLDRLCGALLPAGAFERRARRCRPAPSMIRAIRWSASTARPSRWMISWPTRSPCPSGTPTPAVTPTFIRRGIANVFENAHTPDVMVNDLLQAKFAAFGQETDPAGVEQHAWAWADCWTRPPRSGCPRMTMTLAARWAPGACPTGPYLVLPLFGPSDLRDGLAKLPDQFAIPQNYIRNQDGSTACIRWTC